MAYDLYSLRRQNDVNILVNFGYFLFYKVLSCINGSIHDRKRSIKVIILIGYEGYNRIRIIKRLHQYFNKEKHC